MAKARLRAAVILLAACTAVASSSTNGIAKSDPVSVSVSTLAPADAYFGREKLSPLGIRHTTLTLKDDLHHNRQQPEAIEHKAEFVEDALDDWATRYPHDPWIASAAWQLGTLFEELPGTAAHEHAIVVLALLRDRFAGTTFADDAQRDLARGIGVRPWPSGPVPTNSPAIVAAIDDPQTLVNAIIGVAATPDPQHAATIAQLEDRFWALSQGGTNKAYERAAWELAAAYERLPGAQAQTQAIRLLALLVDRYPGDIFGRWAMRDLARGIGERT